MATQSRLLQYTDKICRDDSGIIQNGDKLFPKMILRFNNGLLHGEGEPAAEYLDGHHEWWKMENYTATMARLCIRLSKTKTETRMKSGGKKANTCFPCNYTRTLSDNSEGVFLYK